MRVSLFAILLVCWVSAYAQQPVWQEQHRLPQSGIGADSALGPGFLAASYYDAQTASVYYAEFHPDREEPILTELQSHSGSTGYFFSSDTALSFDDQGNPHVFYRDLIRSVLVHAHRVADEWYYEDIQNSFGYDEKVSATQCGQNLCICYSNSANEELIFAEGFLGDWQNTLIEQSVGREPFYCDIAEDSLGVLHISYSLRAPYQTRHSFRIDSNSSWSAPADVLPGSEMLWPKLAVGPNGEVRITGSRYLPGQASDIGYHHLALQGSNWVNVSTPSNGSYLGGYPSVALGAIGNSLFVVRRRMQSALFGSSRSVYLLEQDSEGNTTNSQYVMRESFCMRQAEWIEALIDENGTQHFFAHQRGCGDYNLQLFSKVTPPAQQFSFSGNVRDTEGRPIGGAAVKIRVTSDSDGSVFEQTVLSAADGSYLFQAVSGPGAFEVEASRAGWDFTNFSGSLYNNWTWNFIGQPSSDPLDVRVIDQNGTPLDGIQLQVSIPGQALQLNTDQSGAASFEIPYGSRYELSAIDANCSFRRATLYGELLGRHQRLFLCELVQ